MFPNKADNEIAAKDPQPGDYWSEMFCPVCLVVGRKENKVFIYENYKPIDKGYWSWDTEKVSEYDIKDFQSKISHETIGLLTSFHLGVHDSSYTGLWQYHSNCHTIS